MSLLLRAGAEKFGFVLVAEHEKCNQLLSRMTASVTRGRDISQPMKLHRWMMMGNRCFRVSGVAGIMIAVIVSMLSDMRRGKDD